MSVKRKKYSKQFKLDTIQMYENGEKSMAQVERELGISGWAAGEMADGIAGSQGSRRSLSGEWEPARQRSAHPAVGAGECPTAAGERNPKKSAGDLLKGCEMKYLFIEKHQPDYPVGRQCQALGVSRSGYYAWRARQKRPEDETLAGLDRAYSAHSPKRAAARMAAHASMPSCERRNGVQSQAGSPFDAPGRAVWAQKTATK